MDRIEIQKNIVSGRAVGAINIKEEERKNKKTDCNRLYHFCEVARFVFVKHSAAH